MSNKPLTTQQIEEATKQEQIIDDGLSSYVEVGLALRKIQSEGLHDGKFIDYAMDRFALKSHTVYRIMRAAEVAKNLLDAGLRAPKNAGQAHRIHDLRRDSPDDQVELWHEITKSGIPVALSQIDKFADQNSKYIETIDDESDDAGEIDMDSVHHVEPVELSASEADPLPCLQRAKQELQSVANAIDDGFNDFTPLEVEIEQLEALLMQIRNHLSVIGLVA